MDTREARDIGPQPLPRPLFRRAAIEHAGHSLAGDVILARAPSSVLLVTVYCGVLAVSVSFFAATGFLRRAADPTCAATPMKRTYAQHAGEQELLKPCPAKQGR
jgi:hypothetical protein